MLFLVNIPLILVEETARVICMSVCICVMFSGYLTVAVVTLHPAE